MSHDEKDGGFISHLAELRKRLIYSFLFLIIFWGLAFILPAAYLIIKGIPKFFRNIPNFFGVLFVIIVIFISVIFGSYISVN